MADSVKVEIVFFICWRYTKSLVATLCLNLLYAKYSIAGRELLLWMLELLLAFEAFNKQ